MKIIITGSLGHISKPLTKELVEKGHDVTVISSKSDKQKEIETMGARAAIGDLEDAGFIAATFRGADSVYCMIPPNHFFMDDAIAYYRRIAGNYVQAIRQAGVKRVIHLSTYGADLDSGTGLILGSHNAEKMFNELQGITITHMRPTYFYYNLYAFTDLIKKTGTIQTNYGQEKVVMVAPVDIAAAVADEILRPASGINVRYVASDEHTGEEIAAILGKAMGKPDLKWIFISDEQSRKNLEANGLPGHTAEGLVEMFASIRTGRLPSDYQRHKPDVMGKVKLEDFAEEFAAVLAKN